MVKIHTVVTPPDGMMDTSDTTGPAGWSTGSTGADVTIASGLIFKGGTNISNDGATVAALIWQDSRHRIYPMTTRHQAKAADPDPLPFFSRWSSSVRSETDRTEDGGGDHLDPSCSSSRAKKII